MTAWEHPQAQLQQEWEEAQEEAEARTEQTTLRACEETGPRRLTCSTVKTEERQLPMEMETKLSVPERHDE